MLQKPSSSSGVHLDRLFPVNLALCISVLISSLLIQPLHGYHPPDGDQIDHVQLPEDLSQYLNAGHGYIIQRALDILRADGNPNWAAIAENHMQSLLDGIRFADTWQGRQGIFVIHKALVFIIVDRTLIRDWPLGGDEHYFNPETGHGFDPGALNELLDAADPVAYLLQYGLMSLVGGGVINILYHAELEAMPPLRNSYASGLDILQRNYDIAYAIAQGPSSDKSLSLQGVTSPFYQGRISSAVEHRGAYDTAFFHLGWALHLLHDMTIVNHTYDSFFSNHTEYENSSNGKGGRDDLNASSGGIYESMLPNLPFCQPGQAKCFGAYAATQVHNDTHFDLVKDGQFDRAHATALPLAERLSAGMIAKFMASLGFPNDALPIRIHVSDENSTPIPGAYVFYKIQAVPNGTWNYRRTDENGYLSLQLPFGHEYIVRPTKPGYHFYGKDLMAEFVNRSPDYFDTSQPEYTPFSIQRHYVLFKGTAEIDPGSVPGNSTVYQDAIPQIHPSLDEDFEEAIRIAASNTIGDLDPALNGYLEGEGLASKWSSELQRALITFGSDTYDLGVINNGVGLPVESTVTIQFNQLLQMVNGRVISDMPRLKQVLEADYHFGTPEKVPESLLNLKGGNEEVVARWSHYIPTRDIQTEGEATYAQVPSWPWFDNRLLEDSGMSVVPYLGDIELEVGFVAQNGLLRSTQTIQLTSNHRGLAQFKLHTGSRAGLLRLRVQVKNNPSLVEFYQPKDLEFLVHPNLAGSEPTFVAPELLPVASPTLVMDIDPDTVGSSWYRRMDASASFATNGIESFKWYISDGRILTGPIQNCEFAKPGSYEVILRVMDQNGVINEDVRTIIIAENPLQAWQMKHFRYLESEGIDDLIDTDHDGMLNFVEFSLDQDPWVADGTTRRLRLSPVEDGFESLFYCDPEQRDLSYLLEQSVDLKRWRPLFDSQQDVDLVEQYLDDNKIMHLPVRQKNTEGESFFYRFRVRNNKDQ